MLRKNFTICFSIMSKFMFIFFLMLILCTVTILSSRKAAADEYNFLTTSVDRLTADKELNACLYKNDFLASCIEAKLAAYQAFLTSNKDILVGKLNLDFDRLMGMIDPQTVHQKCLCPGFRTFLDTTCVSGHISAFKLVINGAVERWRIAGTDDENNKLTEYKKEIEKLKRENNELRKKNHHLKHLLKKAKAALHANSENPEDSGPAAKEKPSHLELMF